MTHLELNELEKELEQALYLIQSRDPDGAMAQLAKALNRVRQEQQRVFAERANRFVGHVDEALKNKKIG